MAAARSSGREGRRDVNPAAARQRRSRGATTPSRRLRLPVGYFGGIPYFGRDLNGDGDLLDTVRVLAPSQTHTKR